MAHVFFRITARDFLVYRQGRRQRRLFRVRAGVDFVDGARCGNGGLRWRLFRDAGLQHLNDARPPFGGGGLVFDISVYAIQQALCTQLRQLAVEIFTGLAEKFIGRVTEAEDGKGGALELWRFFREQELMQRDGFFRRLAFALR